MDSTIDQPTIHPSIHPSSQQINTLSGPNFTNQETDSGQLSDLFNTTKPAIYRVPEPGELVRRWTQGFSKDAETGWGRGVLRRGRSLSQSPQGYHFTIPPPFIHLSGTFRAGAGYYIGGLGYLWKVSNLLWLPGQVQALRGVTGLCQIHPT